MAHPIYSKSLVPILITVGVLLHVALWFVVQGYMLGIKSEASVYPTSIEDTQVLELVPGDILEQHFFADEDGLTKIEIWTDGSMASGSGQLAVAVSSTTASVSLLDISTLKTLRVFAVEVPQAIQKNERVILRLELKNASDDAIVGINVQANKQLDTLDAALRINGATQVRHLVFTPKYKDEAGIMMSDHASVLMAFAQIERVMERRPVHVQYALLSSALIWFSIMYLVLAKLLGQLLEPSQRLVVILITMTIAFAVLV